MNRCQNKAIECTVTSCANHCTDGSSYCALDKICVGSHTPAKGESGERATDCCSFVSCK